MLLTSFTGCWDRREPDVIGLVVMAAFDWDAEVEMFSVVAQVANPLGGTAGEVGNGEGGGGRAAVLVVEAKGHTVFEAIQNLELISTRNLIWTHLNTLIFTESLAGEGLRPVLDYLDRERQTRLITHPLIVQGDARKLLETEFPLEQLGGQALDKQHRFVLIERSVSPWLLSLRELFQLLARPGQELVMPTVLYRGGMADQNENNGDNGEGSVDPNPFRIAGAAVFRGDQLAGYFEERETAGYMWFTGQASRSIKIVKCPEDENEYVTVEIFESSSELVPVIDGEEVRFRLSIMAEGRIQDFTCAKLPLEEDFIASLNRQVVTVIRNEVELSLAKAQELQADAFGMGNLLYRTRPQVWRPLEDKWKTIFPEIPVDIEVNVIIRRAGLILEPLKIR